MHIYNASDCLHHPGQSCLPPSMSTSEIVQAYRTLSKLSERAVRKANPSRWQVRDLLREAFSSEARTSFCARRVDNTASFLKRARQSNGYEHKIIKNILYIRYWRKREHHNKLVRNQTTLGADVRNNMWAQYDATLAMLNESQDLCLRC